MFVDSTQGPLITTSAFYLYTPRAPTQRPFTQKPEFRQRYRPTLCNPSLTYRSAIQQYTVRHADSAADQPVIHNRYPAHYWPPHSPDFNLWFFFQSCQQDTRTNIRVLNSHHSLNSTGCGHFANSAINCLMPTSGHSFRVKEETKQLKLLPNVITTYWSTWSEKTFIFCLIANCKRSIVFCDVLSACFPACLTTYVIINISINIRRKSPHCHIPAVDTQTVLGLGH